MVLAVPTPTTRAAGTRLTGAIWQSDVTDTATFLTNVPLCNVYQNTIQSIPNATYTAILMDQEVTDAYGGHSTSSNTSRYTAVVAGWYWVYGTVMYANNSTGFRFLAVTKNGTGNVVNGAAAVVPPSTSYLGSVTVGGPVQLNAGDYVEMATYQTSGGALNTAIGSGQCSSMTVWWIHA